MNSIEKPNYRLYDLTLPGTCLTRDITADDFAEALAVGWDWISEGNGGEPETQWLDYGVAPIVRGPSEDAPEALPVWAEYRLHRAGNNDLRTWVTRADLETDWPAMLAEAKAHPELISARAIATDPVADGSCCVIMTPGSAWPTEIDDEATAGKMTRHTATLDPNQPDECSGDWESPPEVVGGCAENPGVYGSGSGGGVIITEVDPVSGWYRVTDTWAQRPDTGEQGLRSVEYREPDERSLAWVASLAAKGGAS